MKKQRENLNKHKKKMKHIKTFESFLNEAVTGEVKPNAKLEKGTGYPYAMFYISTQVANILVNFEDPNHVALIKLMAEQQREIEKDGELSSSSINKGRSLFKKALGENVSYSKYDGADCTFRLSSTPDVDLNQGKKVWLPSGTGAPGNAEMENYI